MSQPVRLIRKTAGSASGIASQQRPSVARRVIPSTTQCRHSSVACKPQNRLPAAYYRGGSSRAIMFRATDLPTDKSAWDAIFLGAIGSPDPYGRQLDGLGGGISSLSKVCIVGKSTRADADVDYTFAAIGVKNTDVDYSSNCGNMSAAIGPFAVDSTLVSVPAEATSAVVRIHNTNTGKIIEAGFPVVEGEAAAQGDFSIDGVTGTAARVSLKFLDPAGSKTGKLFPTGQKAEIIAGVRATCIDAGNPCVFVLAEDLGVPGELTPQEIEDHPTLMGRLEAIRCEAGVRMGLAKTEDMVPGSIPKVGFVSRPSDGASNSLTIRAMSVGQPHKAVPVTVAMAAAAAVNVAGTTVAECAVGASDGTQVTIRHASGVLDVAAEFDAEGGLVASTVFRTARRLMDGTVYWK
ncbi:PrpF family protein [Candidatus Bathyarchaeota archaeon]|nr:PrpF family protein [Candidatus Bathyarchaeota archaeon]